MTEITYREVDEISRVSEKKIIKKTIEELDKLGIISKDYDIMILNIKKIWQKW